MTPIEEIKDNGEDREILLSPTFLLSNNQKDSIYPDQDGKEPPGPL